MSRSEQKHMNEDLFPQYANMAPAPRPARRVPRWLVIGGLGLAFALVLGLGVAIGSAVLPTFANTDLAAAPQNGAVPRNGVSGQFGQFGLAAPSIRGHGRVLTVTGVSANSFTATATNKTGAPTNVTINTTSSTQYLRLGKTVNRSTIVVGTKIAVQGTKNSDGTITATRVEIVLPSYHGTVTAVSGSDITIKDNKDSTTHVIHTNANTSFTRAGASSSLSAVTVGEEIGASGTLNGDNSLNAEAVAIILPHAGGKITAINGSTVTVQARRGTTTIHLSGSTTYKNVTFGANGPTETAASASDLAVGKYIVAEGAKNSDGSLNAEVVRILPAAPAGGHGWPGKHGTPSTTPSA
jgi:Domain of unknown function (DUF5666)